MDYSINCKNATIYKPTLLLSSGDRYYNPLRDTEEQVINASLLLGSEECAKNKRQFVWELLRSRGQFSAVTADDLEIKISDVLRSAPRTSASSSGNFSGVVDSSPQLLQMTWRSRYPMMVHPSR